MLFQATMLAARPNVGRFLREWLEGGHVKGGLLLARLDFAEKRLAGGRGAVLAHLPSATAGALGRTLLPIAWYPFRALIEIDRAIAAVVGGDAKVAVADLGRHTARLSLTDTGNRIEYERVDDSRGRVVHREHGCWSEVFCWSAIGHYEEAARLYGAGGVRIEETSCICTGSELCSFDVVWS